MKRLYHYTAMFILSLVCVFVLLVFEITAFVSQVLLKSDIYSEAMGKQAVSNAIYEDIDEYFEQYSAPTGIPKEVFTDVLDKSEIGSAAFSLIEDSLKYLSDSEAEMPQLKFDFTPLEESITDYIESYSEENDIEKTDEYYSLIDKTIETAEEQIEGRLDVILLYSLAQSKYAPVIHKYSKAVTVLMIVSAVLVLALIAIMCFINRNHPRDMTYWFGSILFCASAFLLAPSLYLYKINYFDNFFMKSEHTYRTVTSLFDTALQRIIDTQFALVIMGVALVVVTLLVHMIYLKILENRRRKED